MFDENGYYIADLGSVEDQTSINQATYSDLISMMMEFKVET